MAGSCVRHFPSRKTSRPSPRRKRPLALNPLVNCSSHRRARSRRDRRAAHALRVDRTNNDEAQQPPTLLIDGTRDELVFARETRRLQARLADAKAAHLYIEMPWATHGMDANLAGPGGQISTYAIERFLAAVTGPRT